MKLFVAYNRETGEYLTTRRATGKMYVSRSGWSANWSLARPFTTAGAATNAARQAGGTVYEVIEGYFKAKE